MVQASIQNRYLLELADIRLSSDMRCGFCHLNDLQHLHPSNLAVSIQVVHIEGPVEFLLEAASRRDGQGADELSKVNCPITILVKGSKCMLREL